MPLTEINGLSTHYFDEGPLLSARGTILMLHGVGRNGQLSFSRWIPSLAQHYRVIRPDIRGAGRNPAPGPDFQFRVDDVVSDVVALLDHLEIERVHLIGESSGGIMGTIIAATHPERVATLGLVSTPLTASISDPKSKAPSAASPEESLRTLGLREWWLQSIRLSNDGFGDRRDEELADEFALTSLDAVLEMWRVYHAADLTLANYVDRVVAPTLLMTPTETRSTTMAHQEELVAGIKNIRQSVYQGATHNMYYLKADELAQDYLTWLEEVSVDSPSLP